jgi:ubiquinone/menaquinone biosynthesis C-methylase UbiE
MPLDKNPIKTDYSKSLIESKKYAEARKLYYERCYKSIIKEAKIKSASIIIDVPCGGGDFSYLINNAVHSKKLYLVDANKFMIKQARQLCIGDNFKFVQGLATEIDTLVPEPVDVIITTNGFQSYVGDQKLFLKKAYKTLNKKGFLVFDIVTKCFGNKYTLEFYKKWNEEIVAEIKGLNIPIVTPFTKNYLTKGFDQKSLDDLLVVMEKTGYSVKVKKSIEPWNMHRELKMWNRISGRTDMWMPNIPFAKRKKILQKTLEKVISDIGEKPLTKHRFFFYAQKI